MCNRNGDFLRSVRMGLRRAGKNRPGRGQIIGATNSFGEIPVERPVGPPDLAFTILKLLGVDPTRELTTPGGRPIKIMNEGSFIKELV